MSENRRSQTAKDYIESGLKNTGVTNVSVYDTLSKHTSEEIYSRTDHHWMPLGAYYAAQVFCKTAGVKVPDIKNYRKETCGGYVGSMYYYSSDEHLNNDPETYAKLRVLTHTLPPDRLYLR